MKPVLEHLPLEPEESFAVSSFDYPYFPTPWHFHPEYEIVLVIESSGKRFVGDNISDFQTGDLSFLGPNLPHLYRNNQSHYNQEQPMLRARSIIVHFRETSFSENFLMLPEARNIQSLFTKSRLGLDVKGDTREIVMEKLYELLTLTGFS